MLAWLRPRRFRTRLLVLIVGMLAAAQIATYVLVSRANRRTALVTIDQHLARGVQQFESISEHREVSLLLAARMMAGDYAMRQLLLTENFSPATARSALTSYQERIQAPVIVLLAPNGDLLADTRGSRMPSESRAPFTALLRQAEEAETQEASGYGLLDGNLHQMVMVPLLAPPPEVVAWIGIGFPIDETSARELKNGSNLEVTFLTGGAAPHPLATTLPVGLAAELAHARDRFVETHGELVALGGEAYVTTFRRLATLDADPVWIVLQRSLAAELAPSRALGRVILTVTLAGLAVAAVAALALARNLSDPVQRLARHTKLVTAGDYTARIDLHRQDELGDLADAFNLMTAGLAERDRVRDLLDKNVSPEIARQLLRDGAALGGEEREVTILFCDLRGFTTLSEKLPPRELVTLLNRHLDGMSRAIEAEGGVIDKFIGDAIMALFGAPVSAADGADRALRAALAMRRALAELNREFAGEGRPQLAFGIGINTARVVAGNIGSHRRLNYSVVGDGVNLAARLQALTRDETLATDVIASEATLRSARGTYRTRDLGEIMVKGKSLSVHVHALDG